MAKASWVLRRVPLELFTFNHLILPLVLKPCLDWFSAFEQALLNKLHLTSLFLTSSNTFA